MYPLFAVFCRSSAIVFGRRRRNSVLEVSGSQKITQQQYRALLACIDYLEQREAARTDRLCKKKKHSTA